MGKGILYDMDLWWTSTVKNFYSVLKNKKLYTAIHHMLYIVQLDISSHKCVVI